LGLAALTLVGSFLKDRLFCLFCPMLAFINLFQRWQLLRLVKVPRSCLGCGSCRSGCAMDNDASYREKSPKETRLYAPDCLGCFKCAASCSSEGGLNARLGPITLFSSNRKKSL
jgi:polyferredoxin